VKSGPRDDFNFYQSQLRINVECASGMFIGRWGLLRCALPQAMGLKKVVGLVLCLVRLHNFCMDHRDTRTLGCSPHWNRMITKSLHMAGLGCSPHWNRMITFAANGVGPAAELMGGGEHHMHDDTTLPLHIQPLQGPFQFRCPSCTTS
jgi:hypothetical protein